MASVDIGTLTFDAFQDVEGADEYLAGDVSRAVIWATRSDDAKGRGLVSATRMLLSLPWCDTPPDPAAGDAPAVVLEVCAELASDLVASPRLFADASGSSNVKTAKAGSASVEFFSPVDGATPIPKALWSRLLAAGLVCSNTAGTDPTLDGAVPHGTSDSVRPLTGRPPWDWPVAYEDYD